MVQLHFYKIHLLTIIYNSHLIDNCTHHHIYHPASYIIYHVLLSIILPINDHIDHQYMVVTDFNQIIITQPTPSVKLRRSIGKPQLTYTSHKTAHNQGGQSNFKMQLICGQSTFVFFSSKNFVIAFDLFPSLSVGLEML